MELNFTPYTDYRKLPAGVHLVKVDHDNAPYQVAYVRIYDNTTSVVVGGRVHWEAEPLLGYQTIEGEK